MNVGHAIASASVSSPLPPLPWIVNTALFSECISLINNPNTYLKESKITITKRHNEFLLAIALFFPLESSYSTFWP